MFLRVKSSIQMLKPRTGTAFHCFAQHVCFIFGLTFREVPLPLRESARATGVCEKNADRWSAAARWGLADEGLAI